MEISRNPEARQTGENAISRWTNWLVGTRPSQEAVRQHDAQVESNELLTSPSWPKQTVFASPEEEWRHDCLAFARVKNLQQVEEMHAFYLEERGPEGEDDREEEALVVAIGAHYKADVASPEEIILYIVKEMEKIGTNRPYILVYFHANTTLPTFPDTAQLQQIHAALHSSHKRNLKAFYAVHPTRGLKCWIFMLRLAIPEIYGKVEYIEQLDELQRKLGARSISIPQHVIDHDKSLH